MCWHKPADGATCDVFTRNTDALNTPPLPSPALTTTTCVLFRRYKDRYLAFYHQWTREQMRCLENQRAAFLAGGLKYTLPDSSIAATPFAYIKQRNRVMWTSHNVPNTFRAPSSYIRAWACEKNTDLMFYILCGLLCYLSVAGLWEYAREFTFQFVSVRLQALMSCCVYVNHTHPVRRATRLGTDTLRLLPPRSLPLPHSSSHCLVRNSLCCEVKKNTKRRRSFAHSSEHLSCHWILEMQNEASPSTSHKQSHDLLWWGWGGGDTELGHKVKACVSGWRTVLFKHAVSVSLPMSGENRMESN